MQEVTAKALFETYYAMPPDERATARWVMSQETLDQIKQLPEVKRNGPVYGVPGYLLGKPIKIEADAEGYRLESVQQAWREATRPRVLLSDKLHEALIGAGVIREGERIRRIVIDAMVGHAVVMHVERFGDTRLLDVVRTLDGIEVREQVQDAAALA